MKFSQKEKHRKNLKGNNHSSFKKYSVIVWFLCVCLNSGCVYFNTFYNAKQFFKKGIEAHRKNVSDKPSSDEIQNFDKAIEKASKILSLHPDSKYVDDALILLGQSFFYKQEYTESQRKFEELISNFPESEFISEARVWIGKIYVATSQYELAESLLREISSSQVEKKFRGQAQFIIGDLYFAKENYEIAANEFGAVIDVSDDNRLKADAQFHQGLCYLKIKDYEKAAEAFKNVDKYDADKKQEFEARFNHAFSQKEVGNYEKAIRFYKKLRGDEKYIKYYGDIEVEIANCYYLLEDSAKAINLYQNIIEDHTKTKASAKAYYYLGLMYEEDKKDYVQAKSHYETVKSENKDFENVNDAEKRSKYIGKFLQYEQNIQKTLLEIAKLESDIDSISQLIPVDYQITPLNALNLRLDSLKQIAYPSEKIAALNENSDVVESQNKIEKDVNPLDNELIEEEPIQKREEIEDENHLKQDTTALQKIGDGEIPLNKQKQNIVEESEEEIEDKITFNRNERNTQKIEKNKILLNEEEQNSVEQNEKETDNKITFNRNEKGTQKIEKNKILLNEEEQNSVEQNEKETDNKITFNRNRKDSREIEKNKILLNEQKQNIVEEGEEDEIDDAVPAGKTKPPFNKEVDSLQTHDNELETEVEIDSALLGEIGELESVIAHKETIESYRKQIIEKKNKMVADRYRLAELYYFEFSQPVSALKVYNSILEDFFSDTLTTHSILKNIDNKENLQENKSKQYSQNELYAHHSMFLAGYINETYQGQQTKADSFYHYLVDYFPDSPYATFAREKLGIEFVEKDTSIVDSLGLHFYEAEHLIYNKENPEAALDIYFTIAEKDSGTLWAQKSLFAAGWVYDYILSNTEKAIETYRRLIEEYPGSQYANEIKGKLKEPTPIKPLEEILSFLYKNFEDTTVFGDSSIVNEFNEFDEQPKPAAGDISIQDSLAYPQIALDQRIEGTSVITIVVSDSGKVVGWKVDQTAGLRDMDKAATEAIKSVEWIPGEVDGKTVMAKITVPVKFELPKGLKTQEETYESNVTFERKRYSKIKVSKKN